MTPAETWRPIPGYENYEASSLGRIKAVARTSWHPRPSKRHPDGFARTMSERILSPGTTGGYLMVRLYADGKARSIAVHTLVALAFLGPRPDGAEVCHTNDVKLDNRVENLRYDTRSENQRDRTRNGIHYLAERTHCPRGHAYDEANTYHARNGRSRACRACRRKSD